MINIHFLEMHIDRLILKYIQQIFIKYNNF